MIFVTANSAETLRPYLTKSATATTKMIESCFFFFRFAFIVRLHYVFLRFHLNSPQCVWSTFFDRTIFTFFFLFLSIYRRKGFLFPFYFLALLYVRKFLCLYSLCYRYSNTHCDRDILLCLPRNTYSVPAWSR